MTAHPKIRIFGVEDWQTYKRLRLRALADSPDAFGSTLAREENRPDTEWQSRLRGDDASWNLPLFVEAGGEPVGLAWGRIVLEAPEIAHLYQMWVAPTHRGLGLGRRLLNTVIDWAKEKNTRYLDLGVTLRDSPAMQLYLRSGFKPVGEPEALRPGSKLLGQAMRLDLG